MCSEQTRTNILSKLKLLEMSLVYIRDTLLTSFLKVPIDFFFELKGNSPLRIEDRLILLNRMTDNMDVELFRYISSYIVNSNDKELAEKYSGLDLLVWQLTILTSRIETSDQRIARVCEVVAKLLKNIYSIKTEMLHKEFFEFDYTTIANNVLLFERIENDKENSKYAGWKQLENTAGYADEVISQNPAERIDADFLNSGKFEMKSALSDKDIEALYLFLGNFRTQSGPVCDKGIIDISTVSLESFRNSLVYACYTGFDQNNHKDQLKTFICRFSSSYIANYKEYRNRAALSMGMQLKQLEKYNVDGRFAAQFKKILPLIKFNKFK